MGKVVSVLLVALLFICSCEYRELQCKSRADGSMRLCGAGELAFIDDWNWVVDKINNFNISEFETTFLHYSKGDYTNPKLVLLGEIHNHIEGIVENWGYVSYLAQHGKIHVLLEGQGFNPDNAEKNSLDGIWQIITVILHKRMAEEGIVYEPKIWDTVAAARLEKAFNEFLSSIEHLHRPKNFGNLEFSYWDKRGEKYDYAGLVNRNTSMVKAITHALQQDAVSSVVVIAGSTHLPLGEYYNVSQLIPQLNQGILPDFANYYTEADAMRIERSQGKTLRYYEEWLGSSKVIHEFLSLQAHIVQAIPRKTLAFWRRLVL